MPLLVQFSGPVPVWKRRLLLWLGGGIVLPPAERRPSTAGGQALREAGTLDPASLPSRPKLTLKTTGRVRERAGGWSTATLPADHGGSSGCSGGWDTP